MKELTRFLPILLLAFLISCSQDDDSNDININPIPMGSLDFGATITRDFIGVVEDNYGNPIEGVLVQIGTSSTTTDIRGIFVLRNASVYEKFGYVTAEKQGYLNTSRSVVTSEGTNQVTIRMLPATVTATINSGSTETVSLSNGASVLLNGAYVTESGSNYDGEVQVILHHLDPIDENMALQMPGMLLAQNSEGNSRMLKTLGMLAVELRGSSGQELNIASGSNAEIIIPVDNSLLPQAPPSIPLWFFNEEVGYWIEEGTAVLEGNKYRGSVTHFSFWNCDIPAEYVNLCITVTDDNGTPLSDVYIELTSQEYGSAGGYTNKLGLVCGIIPANESLLLEAYVEECSFQPVYTQNIGPFSDDQSISISIDASNQIIQETIVGNIVNCNGDPINNGYAIYTYGQSTQAILPTGGSFQLNTIRCQSSDEFFLEAIDLEAVQTSSIQSFNFNTPLTNVGTLMTCETIDEYIQVSADNGALGKMFLSNINAKLQPHPMTGQYFLFITSEGNEGFFQLYGNLFPDPPYTGTYPYHDPNNPTIPGLDFQAAFDGEVIRPYFNNDNNITYEITNIGGVNEYIDIIFSGDFIDEWGNNRNVSGTVHVIRQE